jgi:glycosyltransferase involved in cell wall biosynthesis
MPQPKITIIIPLYNTALFLEKCVSSVRGQTHPNLEIIIVDDGSTDGSGELADRLAENDERIKVIHQANSGASIARNRGIEAATGEYIGFVDSDDYIAPEMYAHLLELMGREDLMMTQAARCEIDQSGQRLPNACEPPEKETIIDSPEFLRELLLHRGDASLCTKLTKASLFAEERFPEGVLNEDFHLLVRLLPRVGRVGMLPEQYYHVLCHTGSTTRRKNAESFSRSFHDIIDNADMMEELVARDYPRLTTEAKRFALYQRLEYLLHVPISQMSRDNAFYKNVVRYLRDNRAHIRKNPYLTAKNKRYLLLFALAPRTIRQVHALVMRLRRRG